MERSKEFPPTRKNTEAKEQNIGVTPKHNVYRTSIPFPLEEASTSGEKLVDSGFVAGTVQVQTSLSQPIVRKSPDVTRLRLKRLKS